MAVMEIGAMLGTVRLTSPSGTTACFEQRVFTRYRDVDSYRPLLLGSTQPNANKRDVTALSNERCKFHTQYQSVSVKIYEDSALELHRSGLNQESESMGACEDTGSERFFELEELLARHKKILKLEASSFPVAMQPPEHKEHSR